MGLEDKICDVVEYYVEKGIENAKYDKTIQATILSCENPTEGKYLVKYQDTKFYAYSSSNLVLNNGTLVYILIHNNDMNQVKTIVDTVDKLGADFVTNIEYADHFETIGKNLVEENSQEFGLCSYNNAINTLVLYQSGDSKSLIKVDNESALRYAAEAEGLSIQGTFRTALPLEQRRSGNFGLIVYTTFYSSVSKSEEIKKKFILDINHMKGTPYNMEYGTEQSYVFPIDGINLKSIDRIEFFKEGFDFVALGKPLDLFVKNIQMFAMNEMTDSELEGLSVSIDTSKTGNYFSTNRSEDVILNAIVKYKGARVISNGENLTYYWFKQDMSINRYSPYYNALGGFGWKCLNRKLEDDKNSKFLPDKTGEYRIKKSDNQAEKTIYKCVALYSDYNASKTIDIYNYDNMYDADIIIEPNTTYFYRNGSVYPKLTCKFTSKNPIPADKIRYKWAIADENGVYTELLETYQENYIYADLLYNLDRYNKKIDEGYATLAEIEERDHILDQIARQNEVIKTGNVITYPVTRVNGNVIENVNTNLINLFSVYTCSVMIGDGLSSDLCAATAELQLNIQDEIDDTYTIHLINGNKVFKYNANGTSPNGASAEKPMVIEPISFEIRDKNSHNITADILDNCSIVWKIPIKETMLQPVEKGEEKDGYYWYYDLKELQYDIGNKYNFNYNNNDIIIEVNYKGKTYVANTTFLFVKDGENGTNGTDIVCRIEPNTSDNLPTMFYPILNLQYAENNLIGSAWNFTTVDNKKWFKISVYENGNKITNFTAKWSMLRNKYGAELVGVKYVDIYDTGLIDVDENGNCSINNEVAKGIAIADIKNMTNIIECEVTYKGKKFYATLPLATAAMFDSNYEISIKPNTGTQFVIFDSNGTNPMFNTDPFEIKAILNDYEGKRDISTTDALAYSLTYSFSSTGQIYANKAWKDDFAISPRNSKKNTTEISLISRYDGYCKSNGLLCKITRTSGSSLICKLYIPIHLMLNRYGLGALNDWDGNSISIDNESGTILAPQIGAGKKEADNSFTGMVMGEVREGGESQSDVGLFAFKEGKRSIALNAYTGSAIFGTHEGGQIIIDPSTNKGLIYSENFWSNYFTRGKNKGLPNTDYSWIPAQIKNEYGDIIYKDGGKYKGQSNAGAIFDFSTPRIAWGNGNFIVSPEGRLYAQDATVKGTIYADQGTIGKWELKNGELRAVNVDPAAGGIVGEMTIGSNFIAGKNYQSPGSPSYEAFQLNANGKAWFTTIELYPPENGSISFNVNGGTIFDAAGFGDIYYRGVFYGNFRSNKTAEVLDVNGNKVIVVVQG